MSRDGRLLLSEKLMENMSAGPVLMCVIMMLRSFGHFQHHGEEAGV